MLIDENSLDIACSQGHPGDEEWIAKASVPADLTPVMPYINAVVRRPEYYPDVPAVIWPHEDRQVAVRPHKIAVNHVPDSEAAAEEVRWVVAWINDLWRRRGEITPDREPKSPPPLMSVLKLLPMNNCGDCALPHLHGVRGQAHRRREVHRGLPGAHIRRETRQRRGAAADRPGLEVRAW